MKADFFLYLDFDYQIKLLKKQALCSNKAIFRDFQAINKQELNFASPSLINAFLDESVQLMESTITHFDTLSPHHHASILPLVEFLRKEIKIIERLISIAKNLGNNTFHTLLTDTKIDAAKSKIQNLITCEVAWKIEFKISA